jgi:hypothetical protein
MTLTGLAVGLGIGVSLFAYWQNSPQKIGSPVLQFSLYKEIDCKFSDLKPAKF